MGCCTSQMKKVDNNPVSPTNPNTTNTTNKLNHNPEKQQPNAPGTSNKNVYTKSYVSPPSIVAIHTSGQIQEHNNYVYQNGEKQGKNQNDDFPYMQKTSNPIKAAKKSNQIDKNTNNTSNNNNSTNITSNNINKAANNPSTNTNTYTNPSTNNRGIQKQQNQYPDMNQFKYPASNSYLDMPGKQTSDILHDQDYGNYAANGRNVSIKVDINNF